jgi:hypothetical protein
MNILALALCILSGFTTDQHLTKEQQIAVLSEAQTAYEYGVSLQTSDPVAAKESFRRSVERFEILVQDGVENGFLFYDLGNANVQAGEFGKAIAAYLSAGHFIPADGRLLANLQHARSLVQDPIQRNKTSSLLHRLAFWHDSLPANVRLIFGIVAWSACWVLITIRLFREPPGFKTSAVCLGFFAIAMSMSVGSNMADQHLDHGVLTAREVIVRKGNGTNYAPMFKEPIHEGVEFEIIEQRPNWLHIKLQNGATGWIHVDDAQIV